MKERITLVLAIAIIISCLTVIILGIGAYHDFGPLRFGGSNLEANPSSTLEI